MIRELINFTNHLTTTSPEILQWNNKPSTGLHIFVELDENGGWKNKELNHEVDYIYFDGNDEIVKHHLIKEALRFQAASDYITMNKVQRFDPKQKIHSCSPFAVAFNFTLNTDDKSTYKIKQKPSKDEKPQNDTLIKTVKLGIVKERLDDYHKNACSLYFKDNETAETNFSKRLISIVKDEIWKLLPTLNGFTSLGEKDYIRIYLKTYPIEKQELYYSIYLKENIFNKEEFSIESEDVKYGASGFINTFADGKIFLKHRTSSLNKGVSFRLSEEEALNIEKFKDLFTRKPTIFPNPLPLIIDENEFKTNVDIIKIFNEDGKRPSYSEILKRVFEKNENTVLSNYYLLNMIQTKDGLVINDFDFVSLFRYKIDNCKIENLLQLKDKSDIVIHSVFGFESIVVRQIFNNSLVKVDTKKGTQTVKYFDDIDPLWVSGGDQIYHLIIKYRKAIYDYIYKSKLSGITSLMFDDMMLKSIMGDIKEDKFDKFHSKDTSIKEKLNTWFSLYNFFALNENQKRKNMAENLKQHQAMMQELIEGKREIATDNEFVFVAGQVVCYLLSKSQTADKSYSRLEPFLQKSNCGEFKKAVVRIFDMYKHENFSNKFSKAMAQVMAYNTDANLKELTPEMLAGFFTENLLFSDKNKQTENQ